jgi:hypothetical protein
MTPPSQVLDFDVLSKTIKTEIKNAKFQLDYETVDTSNEFAINEISQFIRKNYGEKRNDHALLYSTDLIRYFAQDCLTLCFYPKGKKQIVGVIMGKRTNVRIKNNATFHEFLGIDVDFLCLVKPLRKLHISPYMINVLTISCIKKYQGQVKCAFYTSGKRLDAENFGEKCYYHRPIVFDNLLECFLLDESMDTKTCRTVYGTFSYVPRHFVNKEIVYFRGSCDKRMPIGDMVDLQYKIENYANRMYHVYTVKTIQDLQHMFRNPAFHHFVFKRDGCITDYVCMFELQTACLSNSQSCDNGYVYVMFFERLEDSYKASVLEKVCEICSTEGVFDMVTVLDMFDDSDEYRSSKLLKGTGALYFYMYNVNMSNVLPSKNGIVTI